MTASRSATPGRFHIGAARSRAIALVTAVLTAVALASCGTRLEHQAAVDAAQVVSTEGAGGSTIPGTVIGPNGSGRSLSATSTATLNPGPARGSGGSTAAQGLPVPGRTSGGSSGVSSGGTSGQTSGSGATGGVAGGGGTGASQVANKSLITLGNIGTYTGVIGESLKGLQEAIQVWAKWTNAHGGLNGHPVKVIIADDGGDPSTALTVAKRMVQQDHILAFFDPFLLFDFNEITQYAASVNVPIIGGDGTDDRWYTTGILFPQTATLPTTVRALNRVFMKSGQHKIGIVYCVEVPNLCGPVAEAVKAQTIAVGGQMVYSASASFTAPSFTSICLNAKQAGVEGLWIFLDGASESRLARDCKAQGFTPRYAIHAINTTAAVIADPNMNGTLVAASVFPAPASDTPATQLFHQAFTQYAPSLAGRLSGTAAQAWVAGQLAVAASKYLTDQPTSQQFLQGLWSIRNNTLSGLTTSLTFTKGGHASPGQCAFTASIQNGRYTAPQGSTAIC